MLLHNIVALIFNGIAEITLVGYALLYGVFSSKPNMIIYWEALIALFFLYTASSYVSLSIVFTPSKVRSFKRYKAKTIARIKKLGGNPEVLDGEKRASE